MLAQPRWPEAIASAAEYPASLLDPNGIPGAVFDTPTTLAYLTQARGEQPVTADDAAHNLRNLDRLSLINHDPTSPTHTVRIHSLAQRATREQTPVDQIATLVRVSGKGLLEAWPDSEHDGIGTIFRRNTSALLDHAGALIGDDEAFTALLHVSASLFDAGQYDAAMEHAQYVQALAEQYVGPDHLSSLRARQRVGAWQLAVGDHANALATFQELLPALTRLLGADHDDTFRVRRYIAQARGETGEAATTVVAELEDILTEQIKLGKHVSALPLAELAHWRREAGDVARAISDYQDLFADCLDELGPDDPTTLDIQCDLAEQFSTAGDHVGALTELQDLVPRMQRVYGQDDSRTLLARRRLAEFLGYSGDHAAALVELQDLVPRTERIHGRSHSNSLHIRTIFAHERAMVGDISGAIETYQQLLDDRLELFNRNDDPDTLSVRFCLAQWRGTHDGHAAAAAAFAELVPDMVRVHGPGHPWTLLTRTTLAKTLAQTGDPQAAAAAYQQLRVAQEQVLGPDHPETLYARAAYAEQLIEAGDYQAAKSELENLVPCMQQILDPNDPVTLSALCHLAWAHNETGDCTNAKAELEDLVPRAQQILGPDDPVTLAARGYLAWCRGDAGDPVAAATAYLDLLADCLPTLGARHPSVMNFVGWLVHWHRVARSGRQEPTGSGESAGD